MIVPMKKFILLVYHEEYTEFLKELRNVGLLHIEEKNAGLKKETLADKNNLLNRYDSMLRNLKRNKPDSEAEDSGIHAFDTLVFLENMMKEQEEIQEKLSKLEKEIKKLEPWGNYSPEQLRKLEEEGYIARLYSCPTKRFNPQWEEEYYLSVINNEAGRIYFVIFSQTGEEVNLDLEEEPLAERSLGALRDDRKALKDNLRNIQEQLNTNAGEAEKILERGKHELLKDIEFHSTIIDTENEAEGKLKLLTGWIPQEKEETLVEFLKDQEVYYTTGLPGEDDNPPIQLRNKGVSRLLEPVSKIFDLPSYSELDLTPFFAPFFMLFFGFALGDAGYGLFFIVVASLLKLKVKKEFKPLLSLGQLLGIATVIFGVLSGTFFGINLLDSGYLISAETLSALEAQNLGPAIMDGLRELKGIQYETQTAYFDALKNAIGEEALNKHKFIIIKNTQSDFPLIKSFRHIMQSPINMFYLSMLIGAVQIIFGKILYLANLTRQKGLKYGLSTLGWILFILVIVVFQGGSYLGLLDLAKLDAAYKGGMILSALLIIFFNNPDSSIFMRPLNAIWDAYGVVTGIFQDLLSYIRLFALGISSAILGFVFNDISLQTLSIPYVGWLFFVLLLLVGHGLNIFLASLGAFIHPMRLTFVEFYKNAGFTGGGKEYKPFSNN